MHWHTGVIPEIRTLQTTKFDFMSGTKSIAARTGGTSNAVPYGATSNAQIAKMRDTSHLFDLNVIDYLSSYLQGKATDQDKSYTKAARTSTSGTAHNTSKFWSSRTSTPTRNHDCTTWWDHNDNCVYNESLKAIRHNKQIYQRIGKLEIRHNNPKHKSLGRCAQGTQHQNSYPTPSSNQQHNRNHA